MNRNIKNPPSLVNIFKELKSDLGVETPSHGDLTSWASQGVLLLNTCLTVEQGKPLAHKGLGWEIFTDFVIKSVSEIDKPKVFLLWGAKAQEKQNLIKKSSFNHVLTAPHPSPFSAHSGFFGCKHFSQTNQILEQNGLKSINWSI